MQIQGISLFVLLTGCMVFSGCQQAAPRIGGTSSMKMLEPVPSPDGQPGAGEAGESGKVQFREARLRSDAVQPAYPARALAANLGVVQVCVRIAVDAHGRVSDLQPSVRAATLVPTRYTDDFWTEIEKAVRQWIFAPARVEQIETVQVDGFSYDRVRHSVSVDTEFDFVFTFTP
jgi:outer membrane biosynthesis protein TonB